MKKKINIFLLSFIFFISSFLPCLSVYAQGNSWTVEEKVRYVGNAFYKILTDISGVLVPSGLNGRDLQRDFQAYVLNSDVIQDNMSYDEWIAQEIDISYENGSSGNSNITFSPTFQNTLNSFAHDYIESYEPFVYGYSLSCRRFRDYFPNADSYNSFVSFFNEHSDSIIFFNGASGGQYFSPQTQNLFFIEIDPDVLLVKDSNLYYGAYTTHAYNDNWVYPTSYIKWTYNKTDYSFTSQFFDSSLPYFICLFPNETDNSSQLSNGYFTNCVIDSNCKQYIVYSSQEDMRDAQQGVLSYYVTDSYNTNNTNISTSYTTTTSNIDNSITYGDVQNYVNNYYVENNSYPTTNNVYNYINNYVPPSDGGGGSGGSGSDFDWSFLGTIGEFLGGLISAVGNVLSGILSAITDIIDMFIGENGLPNVIGQLVSYFLPFLPEWILPLIGYSVLLALLLGVIRLIRG